METVKKTYEEPTVQKVEFDFKTRIAASGWDNRPDPAYCDQYC